MQNLFSGQLALTVEFVSRHFIGSESSGYIEVTVRIRGGSPSNPITVIVTPLEWSAKGKRLHNANVAMCILTHRRLVRN